MPGIYPRVTCPRCKGHILILGQNNEVPNFKHIEEGICFVCNGQGTLLKRPDGKMVRIDPENGRWLSYDTNGVFTGIVKSLNDEGSYEEEYMYHLHNIKEI